MSTDFAGFAYEGISVFLYRKKNKSIEIQL